MPATFSTLHPTNETLKFHACDEFEGSGLIVCTGPDESRITSDVTLCIYERMLHAYKGKCRGLGDTSTIHYDLMPKEKACDVKAGTGVKLVEGTGLLFCLPFVVLILLVVTGGIWTIVWTILEMAKGKKLIDIIQSTSVPFLIGVALTTFLKTFFL